MLLVKHIEWTNGHVAWTLTIQSKYRTTRKKTCTHTRARAHRVEQKRLENPCAINDDGGGGDGDDDGMHDVFVGVY